MNTDEIVAMWEKDSVVDSTELGAEALKIPQLHSKYMKILYHTKSLITKLNYDYKSLHRIKYEYYSGILPEEDLKQHGWEPQPLKILKSDIPMYLDSDRDLQNIKTKIQAMEDRLYILENIIKTVNNRGFLIKNAIEWARFQHGL